MSNAVATISTTVGNQPAGGLPPGQIAENAAALQQLAGAFSAAVGVLGKSVEAAGLERVRGLRLQIVEALLGLSAPIGPALAGPLQAIAASCLKAVIRSFPRTAAEEELFARCQTALAAAPSDNIGARALAAVMMAWHAFELGSLPPLTAIPPEIRPSWLAFLLGLPPSLYCSNSTAFGSVFAHVPLIICSTIDRPASE